MEGYKLRLRGLPEPVFAFRITAENYVWENTAPPAGVELSITSGAPLVRWLDGVRQQDPACALRVIPAGERVRMENPTGAPLTIGTVKVILPEAEIQRVSLTGADAREADCLLLPCCMDAAGCRMTVDRLLNTYISLNTRGQGYADRAACAAAWLELVCTVDSLFRQSLSHRLFSGAEYYIRKVDALIEAQYAGTLRVSDMAQELGITPNYLCAVYKKGTGRTIIEAVNSRRMRVARELLQGGCTPQQAAQQVGISSVGYLRRLYKRYYGASITEGQKIDRGLTLYFQKPWEQNTEE